MRGAAHAAARRTAEQSATPRLSAAAIDAGPRLGREGALRGNPKADTGGNSGTNGHSPDGRGRDPQCSASAPPAADGCRPEPTGMAPQAARRICGPHEPVWTGVESVRARFFSCEAGRGEPALAHSPAERGFDHEPDQRRRAAPGARHSRNTNKWGTRQLVTMALMCAIGVLLSFIEFPLIPGVTWLNYDASAMPAMVCGFAFGPGARPRGGHRGRRHPRHPDGRLLGRRHEHPGGHRASCGPRPLIYRRKGARSSARSSAWSRACWPPRWRIVGNLLITPAVLGVPLDAVIAHDPARSWCRSTW